MNRLPNNKRFHGINPDDTLQQALFEALRHEQAAGLAIRHDDAGAYARHQSAAQDAWRAYAERQRALALSNVSSLSAKRA